MLTLTLSMPWRAELVDHVERHPDVPHQNLHRRLGVLVLEEDGHPPLARVVAASPTPSTNAPTTPRRRLERVVVALDARPDDHVGSDRPARSIASRVSRSASSRVASSGEQRAPLPKRASRGDRSRCIDPVPLSASRTASRFSGESSAGSGTRSRRSGLPARQPPSAPSRRSNPGQLGLVAPGVEPRRHVPERPDPQARLHYSPPLSVVEPQRALRGLSLRVPAPRSGLILQP